MTIYFLGSVVLGPGRLYSNWSKSTLKTRSIRKWEIGSCPSHSWAVELCRQEKDLRAVQKQLGHSSTQSSQIYADVLEEDLGRQVRGRWQI